MDVPQMKPMTWALWSPGYTSTIRAFNGPATTVTPPFRRVILLREFGAYLGMWISQKRAGRW